MALALSMAQVPSPASADPGPFSNVRCPRGTTERPGSLSVQYETLECMDRNLQRVAVIGADQSGNTFVEELSTSRGAAWNLYQKMLGQLTAGQRARAPKLDEKFVIRVGFDRASGEPLFVMASTWGTESFPIIRDGNQIRSAWKTLWVDIFRSPQDLRARGHFDYVEDRDGKMIAGYRTVALSSGLQIVHRLPVGVSDEVLDQNAQITCEDAYTGAAVLGSDGGEAAELCRQAFRAVLDNIDATTTFDDMPIFASLQSLLNQPKRYK
jgi:hypothetical protein